MEQALLEKQLAMDCCKGDKSSQFRLYNRYSKAMYNLCLGMMKNTAMAEDVLQESFVDVFNKIDTYRYESTLGAWIKRIVINHCISELRKNRVQFDQIDEGQNNITDDKSEPLDYTYEVQKVKEAMTQLPDGYRAVTTLYAFEGYDHSEIAQILNISESTSKSQYHRAKEKIRSYLTMQNHI